MKKSSLKNLSFILIAIIAILFTVSAYAQEDALKKIKEIDSKMYKGNVEYLLINYADRESLDKNKMVYNTKNYKAIYPNIMLYNVVNYNTKNGTFKQSYIISNKEFKERLKHDPQSVPYSHRCTLYLNSDSSIYYQDKISIVVGTGHIFFSIISNGPSSVYGRGLSLLTDAKYDATKKEVSGYVFDYIEGKRCYIVAKVEPELGYLASKISCYSPDKKNLLRVIENKDPILVDNKYYIYRNSIDMSNEGNIHTFKIISATFKEPLSIESPNDHNAEVEKINIPVKEYWKTSNLITKKQFKEIASNFSPSQQQTIMNFNKETKFNNSYEAYELYRYLYIILGIVVIGLILYIIKRNKSIK